MNLERRIAKLNRLLETELGRPIHAWRWSESLRVGMHAGHGPVVDQNSGLILMKPIYEQRPLCPELHRQWVLCFLTDYVSEDAWLQQYGTALEWPNNGAWMPCYGASGPLALRPGLDPDQDRTEYLIRCVRRGRSITPQQLLDNMQAASDLKIAQAKSRRRDMIRDILTPGIPGKVGSNDRSFGGTEFAAKEIIQ